MRSFTLLLALMFSAANYPKAARADVIEIREDGTITTCRDDGRPDSELADGSVSEAPELPEFAMTSVQGSAAPVEYVAAVSAEAAANDISPALLEAVIWQESRWRPSAVSRAGALGLAQLMPATARSMKVDPHDPMANLAGGARYLRQQLDRFHGDVEKALAAYNAGPGRVAAFGGVPPIPETRAYVAAVIGRLAASPLGIPGAIR